jgi:glycosyltransferase involved in cell wall biosynthesis
LGSEYHVNVLGWARDARDKSAPSLDGLETSRFFFPGQFGGGLINTLGLLTFNGWLFLKHLRYRPHAIHAIDLDTVLAALAARVFLNTKVIYDIADWYSDSHRVGLLRGFLRRLEQWACRKADLVILAHEGRLSQVGCDLKNVLIFYNTPEDREIAPESMECVPDNGYFAYVGILQPDRGIREIIAAARSTGTIIEIAGFGALEDFCRREAERDEMVVFLGRVSYERALAIEQGALGILALYDPAIPNNRLASPNKLFEAMMLGRPIITSSGTLAADIVVKEQIGLTVPYGDIQALAQTMKFLASNLSDSDKMGKKARVLYNNRYSFSRQCDMLCNAYAFLLRC